MYYIFDRGLKMRILPLIIGFLLITSSHSVLALPTCPGSPVTISDYKEVSSWNNCSGDIKFGKEGGVRAGNKYVGEWQEGQFHGQGTYTWANGQKYVGEWQEDKFHGQGTLTLADGRQYVGEFKDGQSHGQGTYTWADGRQYVGEFKDGKFHGQGTYTLADGQKYVGEWQEDKFHGQGTYTWADGRQYVGEFKDGTQNGQGTFTFPDGGQYVGEWQEDKYHGQGTLTLADGRQYVGEFKDDKFHGQGTYTFPDGGQYVGEWQEDKYHGQGTLTLADGQKYVGEFKDGKFHGQGTYTWKDGRQYVGEFKDDTQNGQGTLSYTNGNKVSGEWSNGIAISSNNESGGGFINMTKNLIGPSSETYVFDHEYYFENLDGFVTSTLADALGIGEFSCESAGFIFSKSAMKDIRNAINLPEELRNKIYTNIEKKFIPTVIKVYEDKIEWTDSGQITPIYGDRVVLNLDQEGETLKIKVVQNAKNFALEVINLGCLMPFKKAD
jgi:hypothetical protein